MLLRDIMSLIGYYHFANRKQMLYLHLYFMTRIFVGVQIEPSLFASDERPTR